VEANAGPGQSVVGHARRVTDDDLERVGGKFDQLIGVIQEKYGYTRERVEKEFNGRMAKFEANQKKSSSPTP